MWFEGRRNVGFILERMKKRRMKVVVIRRN
jgi:hypothetical protein